MQILRNRQHISLGGFVHFSSSQELSIHCSIRIGLVLLSALCPHICVFTIKAVAAVSGTVSCDLQQPANGPILRKIGLQNIAIELIYVVRIYIF